MGDQESRIYSIVMDHFEDIWSTGSINESRPQACREVISNDQSPRRVVRSVHILRFQSFSKCNSHDSPKTPKLAIVPPAPTSACAVLKDSGVPTASITTSKPRPFVADRAAVIAASSPPRTLKVWSAPIDLAVSILLWLLPITAVNDGLNSFLAICRIIKPIGPVPMIATVEPGLMSPFRIPHSYEVGTVSDSDSHFLVDALW